MPADSAVDDALDATLAALDLAGPHPSQVRFKLVRGHGEGSGQLHPIQESGLTHCPQPPADRAGTEPHVTSDAPLGDPSETRIAVMVEELPRRVQLLLQRQRYLTSRAATLRTALDWSLELHAAALDNTGGEL
jgi:hypothetical protein